MVSESKSVLFLYKTWTYTRSKEFYIRTKLHSQHLSYKPWMRPANTANRALFHSLRASQLSNKAQHTERCHFILPYLLTWSFFSLRETLRWGLCDSLFFHAYFWSTQLCWTEIGSWAFSFSEQEVGAGRHRAGWLPLPYDSPGSLPSV